MKSLYSPFTKLDSQSSTISNGGMTCKTQGLGIHQNKSSLDGQSQNSSFVNDLAAQNYS